MTKPILVMIHGRAQGGMDPAALRQTWIDTWAKGLSPGEAALLGKFDIRFPYYADVLDDMAEQANLSLSEIQARGPTGAIDPQFAAFRAEIVEAAMDKAGLRATLMQEAAYQDRGPMQWEWVQTILMKLEGVPGLSGMMLERFTRDVWIYLKYPPVRKKINAIVKAELPASGDVFVLGHSLGSVVAYDVVRTASAISVPLLMTVGSPLGVRKISELLDPRHFPTVAKSWYNAYDVRDVVALRPLDHANFNVDPAVENYGEVHNQTDNAHGIIGYLNNATVAQKLFEAMLG
jgi:hypothetical protein